MPRLRDLGITTGTLPAGRLNAITDVAGVRVGTATVIRDQPSVVRTGVTAIWPRSDIWTDAVFAGTHSFNGNGEMTGLPWIAEQGLVGAPICITNTYSVGRGTRRDLRACCARGRAAALPSARRGGDLRRLAQRLRELSGHRRARLLRGRFCCVRGRWPKAMWAAAQA